MNGGIKIWRVFWHLHIRGERLFLVLVLTLRSLSHGAGEAEPQPCVGISKLTHLSGFGNQTLRGQRLKPICLMLRDETGRECFLMPSASSRTHPHPPTYSKRYFWHYPEPVGHAEGWLTRFEISTVTCTWRLFAGSTGACRGSPKSSMSAHSRISILSVAFKPAAPRRQLRMNCL